MRRAAALAALAALVAAAIEATAATAAPAAPHSVALLERTAQARPFAATWATIATATTGEQVRVRVSTAYPEGDMTVPQRFVDSLASMPHGDELSRLTLYLAPAREVSRVCGGSGVGCYNRTDESIVLAADSEWPPAEQVLAHEYGHHVANNRRNPPWSAMERGPKYWSTSENVCRRMTNGTYAPPSAWWARQRFPAEGFAEAYRFLVLSARPWTPFPTTVDDTLFSFGAATLAAVERDVLAPWRGPTSAVIRGAVRAGIPSEVRVETPLDGTLTLRLRAPAAARLTLIGEAGHVERRGRRTSTTICGQRAWRVRVTAPSPGPFTLVVERP